MEINSNINSETRAMTITMNGQITQEKGKDLEKIREKLTLVEQKENLVIEITTPGGSNQEAIDISKEFLKYPYAQVIAKKNVDSAGIIVLLGFFKKHRYAKPGTSFSFHYPTFIEKIPPEKQKENIYKIQDWISYRTGMSIAEVDKLMKEEKCLSVTEAIEKGLVCDTKN